MYVRQVALPVSNFDRALAWYRDVLGAELVTTFTPPGFAFFRLGETRLLLSAGEVGAQIYLGLDDVETAVAAWRAGGVEVTTEPHVIFEDREGLFDVPGEEWLAFIRDSEGNSLGLMSRRAI